MKNSEVLSIVYEALKKLYLEDSYLIENDVSERCLMCKLAEKLQTSLEVRNSNSLNLKVDCEYNRDATRGKNHPKDIQVLFDEIRKKQQLFDQKNSTDVKKLSKFN